MCDSKCGRVTGPFLGQRRTPVPTVAPVCLCLVRSYRVLHCRSLGRTPDPRRTPRDALVSPTPLGPSKLFSCVSRAHRSPVRLPSLRTGSGKAPTRDERGRRYPSVSSNPFRPVPDRTWCVRRPTTPLVAPVSVTPLLPYSRSEGHLSSLTGFLLRPSDGTPLLYSKLDYYHFGSLILSTNSS